MPGWVAALVLGAVGGPPHAEAFAGLELQARARSAAVAVDGAPVAILELRPSLQAITVMPRLQLSGTYAPRLFVGLVGAPGGRFQHAAEASAELAANRGLRLRLGATGGYGYEDFALTRFGLRTWALEFRPAPVQRYLSSSVDLTAWWTLSRRLTLTVSPGFSVQGAVDAAEQAVVPLQRGPHLGATASYVLTRRDLLLTQLWTHSLIVSGGRSASVLRLWEAWRHQLTRTTRVELGLGAGLAQRRGADATGTALLPVAVGAAEHELRVGRRTVEARLEARVLPYLNRLTSDAYERAELSALVTAPLVERWVFRARLGAATELRAAAAERLLLAEAEAATPLGAQWELVVGGNAVWQRLNDRPGPPFQWNTTISLRGASAVNRTGAGAVRLTLR